MADPGARRHRLGVRSRIRWLPWGLIALDPSRALPVERIPSPYAVWGSEWSPSGRCLASAGGDGTTLVWDAVDLAAGPRQLGTQGSLGMVRWSAGGELVVTSLTLPDAVLALQWDAQPPVPLVASAYMLEIGADVRLEPGYEALATANVWSSASEGWRIRFHAAELARGLGVERSTVSRLLAGDQGLTPAMAARLGRYFQVPALWFLEMQAAYDAERVSADPALAEGVTPRRRDRNFLLTPGGARPLGIRSSRPSEPLRIPYDAFDRNAPAPAPVSHAVRQVEYEGGAGALVCEPK